MPQLKIINASRGSIYRFESLKRKLYNCDASIYFNKQWPQEQNTPSIRKDKNPQYLTSMQVYTTKSY
jgi:hypothetical protein